MSSLAFTKWHAARIVKWQIEPDLAVIVTHQILQQKELHVATKVSEQLEELTVAGQGVGQGLGMIQNLKR